MTFDDAFHWLLGHEGAYSNHPRDPGGETMWGITKRDHPDEDIQNLTPERAKEIYRAKYWTPAGCDKVPEPLRFDLFDAAVNQGPKRAIQFLQAAVGAETDGDLGPMTRAAVNAAPPLQTLARFNGYRLDHYAALSTWPSFGRGWARRVALNLKRAGA